MRLRFIALLRLHFTEVRHHPEIGIVGVGHRHRARGNGHHRQRGAHGACASPITSHQRGHDARRGGNALPWRSPARVFRMADSRNGNKMPTASRIDALAVMVSTMPDTAITFPSTPPAAVTNRMGPTVLSVSLVMLVEICSAVVGTRKQYYTEHACPPPAR